MPNFATVFTLQKFGFWGVPPLESVAESTLIIFRLVMHGRPILHPASS